MRKFVINVNGNSYEVEVEEIRDGAAVTPVAAPAVSAAPAPAPQAAPAAKPAAAAPAQPKPAAAASGAMGAVKMTAPMPGNILDVKVNPGDTVKKNQVILILEAMKMENEIMALQDGKVVSVNVSKGSTVNSGDLLVTLE